MAVNDIPVNDILVNKPVFTHCRHECNPGTADMPQGGCAIHANKPSDCAEYYCMWLACMVKEPDLDSIVNRPDNLGIIFDLVPDGPQEFGGVSICGREVWKNARLSSCANKIIRGIAARMCLGIMLHPESSDRLGRTKAVAESQDRTYRTTMPWYRKGSAPLPWQGYQLYGPKQWVKSYQTFQWKMDDVIQPPVPRSHVIGV